MPGEAQAAAPAAGAVSAGEAIAMSFVDSDAADPAAAILDEVLAGESAAVEGEGAPAEGDAAEGEASAEGEPAAEAAPAAEPAAETPPANDIEAAKLRKGFAKLGEERQKVIELQNQARATIAQAQQYEVKAKRHDEIVSALEADPAGFLLTHGGEALVQKALQGFIDQEKTPAEREIAKLRRERDDDKKAEAQRQAETVAANWRADITSKVQADERFDLVNSLGLHSEVIAVMTGYYEKHSERDAAGNVTRPAILSWDLAAQAIEDTRSAKLEGSKRYGKRAPVTAAGTPAKKDAPAAKTPPGPAKKPPTSLSSVPVAETQVVSDDLPVDDLDKRQAQILAELGL